MNGQGSSRPKLPLIKEITGKKFSVVDVRLKNGTTVEGILVDENGVILGKVVGGQLGVDERPLPFEQKDIDAFRCKGWASRLGLAKWQRLVESA